MSQTLVTPTPAITESEAPEIRGVVRLTARGRTYVAEARKSLQAVEGRARRDLGARRYEQLRDSLDWLVGPEEEAERE